MTDKAMKAAGQPEAKPKEQPKAKQPAKAAKTEPSIYIGPALQGGRLARYTIFKGGVLPSSVDAIAKEHKAIRRLIVPVSKMAEHEKRLNDPSSVEAAMFAEAAKIFSKGGK